MKLLKNEVLGVSELGGPQHHWEYLQAHVEILRDFDSEDEARRFIQSGIYQPAGQSLECQFVVWLEQQGMLRFREPPRLRWNVSDTFSAIGIPPCEAKQQAQALARHSG